MDKQYCITYTRATVEDTKVKAKSMKEAKKKFKEVLPYDKIDYIWEINR